jgi:hypothetical protein
MAQSVPWEQKFLDQSLQEIHPEERFGPEAEEEMVGFDPMDEEHRGLLTLQPTTVDGEKPALSDGLDSAKQRTSGSYTKRSLVFGQTVLLFLLPSFIAAQIRKEGKPSAQPRYTTYLDGLRGVAAWAVLNTHLCARVGKGAGASWGTGESVFPIDFPIPFDIVLLPRQFVFQRKRKSRVEHD